ncbi:hypothetical protein DSO57_1013538 [Entomophthora muscae]|uniref:Uncharacterized protein n=1 Tax=Entomophthora muscae TaxID=34485 RepID=A0ACC2UQI3_9FUNG|nr:hypothetical protein DSO57_1013538 [Entomophthora muscae]
MKAPFIISFLPFGPCFDLVIGVPLPKSNHIKPSRGRNSRPSLAIYNHRPKHRQKSNTRTVQTKTYQRNSRESKSFITIEDRPENHILTVIKDAAKEQAINIGRHLTSEGADLVKKGVVSAKDWIVSLFSKKPKPTEQPLARDDEQPTPEKPESCSIDYDSITNEGSDYQTKQDCEADTH